MKKNSGLSVGKIKCKKERYFKKMGSEEYVAYILPLGHQIKRQFFRLALSDKSARYLLRGGGQIES
jgi:hypothetical protein